MEYDILIIGGGPSGLTAGIYAVRAGYKVAIIEKMFAGGQIANTENIDNYPGIIGISGVDLSMKMLEQAEKLGVQMIYDNVTNINLTGKIKNISTENNGELTAKAVILCMGATPRNLGVDNEERFIGRGISYCALCDGAFYKDKTVAVVGGGNTAVGDCLYLAKFAKKVYLIHRRDKLRASSSYMSKLTDSGVQICYNSVVDSIIGKENIESIILRDTITGENKSLNVDGIFVAIGHKPASEMVAKDVKLDDYGYILSDEDMQTNVPGVFVAGDIRHKKVRQVVTACSDGAIASEMASLYIQDNFSKNN